MRQAFTTVKRSNKSKLGQMNHQIKPNTFSGTFDFLSSHRSTQINHKNLQAKSLRDNTTDRHNTTEKEQRRHNVSSSKNSTNCKFVCWFFREVTLCSIRIDNLFAFDATFTYF